METEDIKNRWQEYTEEPYKKDLNDPDNPDGMITTQGQTSWKEKSSGHVGSCSPTKDQTQALCTGNRALATGPLPYLFGEPLVAQTVKSLLAVRETWV